MKKIPFLLFCSVLFLNIQNALAEPLLRYTYADVNYRYTDPDPGDKLNGVGVGLSVSPFKYFFLEADYSYDSSSDGNVDTFTYGGGVYAPLTDKVHLVLNVGGQRGINHFDELDGPTINQVYVGPELRARLNDTVELNVGFRSFNGGSDGDETTNYNVGLLFALNNSMALTLGAVLVDEDADQGYGGLRVAF